MLQDWVITDKTIWKEYTVDLSDYAGQEVYVAIRHFFTEEEWEANGQGFDVETLNIDDIMFSNIIIDIQYTPTLSYDDLYYFNVTAYSNIPASPKVENLTATANGTSEITLTWDAVADATSYNVYRYGKKIANVTETTFTDNNLIHNTQYCYEVAAVSSDKEHEHSDISCATTEQIRYSVVITDVNPETVYYGTDDELRISLLNDGFDSLLSNGVLTLSSDDTYITFNTNSLDLGEDFNTPNATTEKTFSISIDENTPDNHVVNIKADVASCHHNDPDYASVDYIINLTDIQITVRNIVDIPNDTLVPGDTIVPGDTLVLDVPVVTAKAISTSEIELTWNAVENAISYNVYQDAVEIKSGLTDTTFIVKDLDYDTEYCFYVTAVNDTVESAKSAKVCAKTLGDNIEEYNSLLINLYPNPVEDELFLATELHVKEIAIYDIYGRQATRQQVNETTSQQVVNVADLNSGIYFVNIRTENGNVVKRFVKN